ncbi:TPA: protein SanA [Candidatus Uhrbacteria bacterium]|nr:protein SanA [Candidatus Uhrbacteria bacterium]
MAHKIVRRKYLRRLLIVAVAGCLLLGATLLFVESAVQRNAQGKLYNDVASTPHKKVALLLGSSKYVADGRENLFYNYRINAAVELFHAGKVEYVLISGDNGTAEYSEPEMMQTDLIVAGIPKERIYLDYAGFRTWDSVVRAHKVFLENDFVIVSQRFHNERALLIANKNGIAAIAFNAQDVPIARSPRIWLRERLARVDVFVDVFFHTQPKFLGETIVIGGE